MGEKLWHQFMLICLLVPCGMLMDAVLDAQIGGKNISSLNIQLGRLGQVVVFLKARREVGFLYGLLADRKQCRSE